jgi:archaellum biogenesis ATPase FlaH
MLTKQDILDIKEVKRILRINNKPIESFFSKIYNYNEQKSEGSLLILGGVSGSGKSSLAYHIANYFTSQHKKCFYFDADCAHSQNLLNKNQFLSLSTPTELTATLEATIDLIKNDVDLIVIDSLNGLYNNHSTLSETLNTFMPKIRSALSNSKSLLLILTNRNKSVNPALNQSFNSLNIQLTQSANVICNTNYINLTQEVEVNVMKNRSGPVHTLFRIPLSNTIK